MLIFIRDFANSYWIVTNTSFSASSSCYLYFLLFFIFLHLRIFLNVHLLFSTSSSSLPPSLVHITLPSNLSPFHSLHLFLASYSFPRTLLLIMQWHKSRPNFNRVFSSSSFLTLSQSSSFAQRMIVNKSAGGFLSTVIVYKVQSSVIPRLSGRFIRSLYTDDEDTIKTSTTSHLVGRETEINIRVMDWRNQCVDGWKIVNCDAWWFSGRVRCLPSEGLRFE